MTEKSFTVAEALGSPLELIYIPVSMIINKEKRLAEPLERYGMTRADVIQSSYLWCVESLKRMSPERVLNRSFLRCVISYRAGDYIAKANGRGKSTKSVRKAVLKAAPLCETTEPTESRRAPLSELSECLASVIEPSGVPENIRPLIVSVLMGEIKEKEMAERYNIPASSVSKMVKMARDTVRRRYSAADFFDLINR